MLASLALLTHDQPASAGEDAAAVRANMPVVKLDRLIYEDGQDVRAAVCFRDAKDIMPHNALVLSAPESGDLEVIQLADIGNPLRQASATRTRLSISANPNPTSLDGTLELKPGERFLAMYFYLLSERTQSPGQAFFSADFALAFDPDFPDSPVEVVPEVAMSEDENDLPPGHRKIGTLLIAGGPTPTQIATEDILFRPRKPGEEQEFKDRTLANLVTSDAALARSNRDPVWFRYQMQGDPDKIKFLPQLRDLVGSAGTLVASNQEALAIFASAMELQLDGYHVLLNSRVHTFGPLSAPEGNWRNDEGELETNDSMLGTEPIAFRDDLFGLRNMWAFMAMWEFDENRVPVAFIDTGFAPNPDFRGYPDLRMEMNFDTGARGAGTASVPQEVGNSFFGGKSWHGNGSVTTASGVFGNRFGMSGTGGQVAEPMLYHMGFSSFAFEMGAAIQVAVDDGTSVINISAGYPCNVLTILGTGGLCTESGRTVLLAQITALAQAAAAATCAAAGLIPGLGPVICAAAVSAATAEAILALEAIFFLNDDIGNLRDPMVAGVDYATERGVPIVASAGNRVRDESLGPLAAFIDNGNYNIDDWDVIPASITGVIAAGAAWAFNNDGKNDDDENFRRNLHFWGDRVDLWAPILSWYFAPEDTSMNPASVSPSAHVIRSFGGTSAAAPYISGVIANLMAIDPNLNPATALRGTLPRLPETILTLLKETAFDPATHDEIPADASGLTLKVYDDAEAVVDECPLPGNLRRDIIRRRNLINCYAAVRRAALAVEPDVEGLEALGFNSVFARYDDIGDSSPRLVELNRTDTRGFAEGLPLTDRDQFLFRYPDDSEHTFIGRLQIELPASEDSGALLINGRSYPSRLSTFGEVHVIILELPRQFGGTASRVELRNLGGADTLYRLFARPVTELPLPSADRFDRTTPGNDAGQPVPIGTIATAGTRWEDVPASEFDPPLRGEGSRRICIDDLNLHRADDEDWFAITISPEMDTTSCLSAGAPVLIVETEPPVLGLSISLYSVPDGVRYHREATGAGSVSLDCRQYSGRFPIYVQVAPATSMAAYGTNYNLKIRWDVPDESFAETADRIRDANAEPGENPFIDFRFGARIPWLRGSSLLPPALLDDALDWATDPAGRSLRSQMFFLDQHSAGDLRVRAQLGSGQSLQMELWSRGGQLISSARTPDLAGQQQGGGASALDLFVPTLGADRYILAINRFRPGDEIALQLSENLIGDGSASLEALAAGLGNGGASELLASPDLAPDSPLGALLAPGALNVFRLHTVPALEVRFPASKGVLYQIESSPDGRQWFPAGLPVLEEFDTITTQIVNLASGSDQVRVRKIGGNDTIAPVGRRAILNFAIPTEAGLVYRLEQSTDGLNWMAAGARFSGDGRPHRWHLPAGGPNAPPRAFFRATRSYPTQ